MAGGFILKEHIILNVVVMLNLTMSQIRKSSQGGSERIESVLTTASKNINASSWTMSD